MQKPTLLIALLLAGCGASDSQVTSSLEAAPAPSPPPEVQRVAAYQMGPLQGTLAPSIEEHFNLTPFDGQRTDAPLVIGQLDAAGLKEAFASGQPLVLVQADVSKVNQLLQLLDQPADFQLPAGLSADRQYAEVFAIDREANGDLHTFVEFPPASADLPEDQEARTQELVEWVQENERRERGDEPGLASNDLRALTQAQVTRQIYTHEGAILEVTFFVYACHTFDSQDGSGFDWFYVQQSSQINMARAYKGIQPHTAGRVTANPEQDVVGLYLGQLFLDNHFVGHDNPAGGAALLRNSPENANNVVKVTSGVSWTFGGKIGFNGKNDVGEVTGSGTISHSESFDVTDCKVVNNSASRHTNTEWTYEFKRPEGVRHVYYAGIKEPPVLSYRNFQPKQQWLWRVSPALRDSPQGQAFHTTLQPTFVQSEGGTISNLPFVGTGPFHVEIPGPKWVGHVPLRYPPLLVAPQNLSFAAAGGFQPVDLAVSRAWTATSDQPWCTVNPRSGTGDNPRVFVTADPNSSGADRFATLTFRSLDGKATSSTRVFQSRL